MERKAMEALEAWKVSKRRKPLIVQGARQVGKTWLIREFGRHSFKQVAYITFFNNENLIRAFEGSIDATRLINILSIESGTIVGNDDTLLILDEIQECPRALMALKSFAEERPNIPVIAAGSLLGVALSRNSGQRALGDTPSRRIMFPVGKVDWLTLQPMTFIEFLHAVGQSGLASALEAGDFSLIDAFREKLTDYLRQYYFVGGMPEAVAEFADSHDFREVRTIQNNLLTSYEHDFSKYANATEAERIRLVWRSIPSQLARENRKFVYSAVRPSGRARNFESAIQWLTDAGLVTRIGRIRKPGLPLSAYEDMASFKLYLLDVGLLGARSHLDAATLIDGNRLFTEFKGSLTEQYVCQQMVAKGLKPWYWSADRSDGEVDFIFENEGAIWPVEVKAEENLRAKSLKAFCEKFEVERATRVSMSAYREESWLTNIPLYAANFLGRARDN